MTIVGFQRLVVLRNTLRKVKFRMFGTNLSTEGSRYESACFNSNSRLQR